MTVPQPVRPLRSTLTAVVAGTGALALVACGGGEGTDESSSDVTLQLNWYPYGEHAPLYYGVEEGIFEDHGISLSIEPGQGSSMTVQSVGQQRFDFGWADTAALLSNIDEGVDVRSVGAFLQTTPSAVQVFADSGIEEPEDLRGKTIAVSAGDAPTTAFPMYLEAVGLSEDDVEQQNLDSAGKNAALMSGQVDGLIGFAHDQGPAIAATSGEEINYLRYSDAGLNFFSNGLLTHSSTIEDDPDLVERMVAATSEAYRVAQEAPDEEVVAAMEGKDPQTPDGEVLAEQWQQTIPLLNTENTEGQVPGSNADEEWEQTVSVLAEAGLISEAKAIDEYYDSSFTAEGQ